MTTTETRRMARCTCGVEVPSSPDLAFFEDRSAGTQDHVCGWCRYYREAHERKQRENPPHLSRCCDDFTPLTEGYATDSFYCGHGGWD